LKAWAMCTTYEHWFENFMIKVQLWSNHLSQNRTFYSPVWGLVWHPDSTLQNRTVRLKTGQVVSLL
jgi:hypothetical protein